MQPKIEYLDIHLIKYIQNLYEDNYKTNEINQRTK